MPSLAPHRIRWLSTRLKHKLKGCRGSRSDVSYVTVRGTFGEIPCYPSEGALEVERPQATPRGLDDTISALRDGIGELTPDAGPNHTDGWRPRLEVSGVLEPEPIADGLAGLEDRLRFDGVDAVGRILADLKDRVGGLASTDVGRDVADGVENLRGLLEREVRRLAGAQG